MSAGKPERGAVHALHEIEHDAPAAERDHAGEFVEMLRPARRDAVRELGQTAFPRQVHVLRFHVGIRQAGFGQEEIHAARFPVTDLAADVSVVAELRDLPVRKHPGKKPIRQAGIDSHELPVGKLDKFPTVP